MLPGASCGNALGGPWSFCDLDSIRVTGRTRAGFLRNGFVLPERFRGTEVEDLTTLLRKKVIWHQQGSMDKEDAREVIITLDRLAVAIDKELGIPDAEVGGYR